MKELLKLHNISHFSIWNDSKTDFVKFKSLKLPSHLLGLKEIPMQSFLLKPDYINQLVLTMTKANKLNKLDSGYSHVDCIGPWYNCNCQADFGKVKCYQVNQMIGKRWANSHDLERVNGKQSHSDSEAIEMSTFLKETLVTNWKDNEPLSSGLTQH